MAKSAPTTAKGRATRARVLAAATELVRERGSAGTSLDDVRERAGVSKSQLYHYFEDRDDLLRAVVGATADTVLAAQASHLDRLDSSAAIEAWFAKLVALQRERRARGGCPIGSLVGQLAERDEGARDALAEAFARWQGFLADGLARMRDRGELRADADPARLAGQAMAALQGGLLLTQVRRDPQQLRAALDGALVVLRAAAA